MPNLGNVRRMYVGRIGDKAGTVYLLNDEKCGRSAQGEYDTWEQAIEATFEIAEDK